MSATLTAALGVLATAGGLLLFYASRATDLLGLALCLLVVVLHVLRVRAGAAAA